MSETHYTLKVAGIERELKKVRVAPGLVIASFVMLGDTELVERCADALLPKMPREELDLLVCLEAKGIPLTHALARRLSLDYVTVRKSVKSYMEDPLVVEVRSITTQAPQTLVLDGVDRRRLRGRRVGVVDDVVSTGGSLKAVEALGPARVGALISLVPVLAGLAAVPLLAEPVTPWLACGLLAVSCGAFLASRPHPTPVTPKVETCPT